MLLVIGGRMGWEKGLDRKSKSILKFSLKLAEEIKDLKIRDQDSPRITRVAIGALCVVESDTYLHERLRN